MARIQNVETWVWACVCLALIALRVYPGFVPNTGHDAYQYLSVAENALIGNFGYTSLIHFDAERSFGVAPAPMVTFPLGYPLAIALVSLPGLSMQRAALVVGALSTAACLLLLACMANQLRWSRTLRNATIAIFVFNAAVIEYGASAYSEALFTLVVLLGVTLLVSARFDPDGGGWRWAAAGFTFGAAYFVRYAGLFFVVGLALVVVRHLLASRRGLAKGYAIAFSMASIIVLVGVARNIVLVGNWRGGNEKIVSNSPLSLLVETASALKGLFVGPAFGTPWWIFIARALLMLSLVAGIGWLIWTRQGPRQRAVHNDGLLKSIGIDLVLLVAVYGVCMFYAGLTTVISYGTRMFVPLFPLVILLIALAAHLILATPGHPYRSRTPALLAFGAGLCLYVFINMFLMLRPPSPSDPSSIARLVASTSAEGKSARSAVSELAGPMGVIMANNGQAVGHAFKRPTLSLVGPHYSAIEWNEKAVRDAVHQFKAAAIVIYVPMAEQWNNDDLVPSPFVRQLAQGDAPAWMTLVYRSNELLVYAPRFASSRACGLTTRRHICLDHDALERHINDNRSAGTG